MVLLESKDISMGTPAPDFSLKGVDDQMHGLSDFSDAEVLVVVFMCNHCPYVQAIWDRLVVLQAKFEDRNVRFVGINPNYHPDYPEDSLEKMKEYYGEYEMNFPYLIDESQKVARAYGAQCTPDIFVYDRERKLQYHGRVDEHAIEALLRGDVPSEDQNPSMGCSIKWRD
ncbi:MAG: thioredoxin family protein [Nitrospirota bacterium]